MVVTLLGMVMVDKAEHSANDSAPRLTTPSPMVTSVSWEQAEKTEASICARRPGMAMLVSFVPAKAAAPLAD